MTTTRPLSNFAVAMMALPAVLGAPLLFLRPEGVWAWAAGMFTLPVMWFGIKGAGKALGRPIGCGAWRRGETPADVRKIVSGSMILASLMLSISLAASLAAALCYIEKSLAQAIGQRSMYVLVGCYFVFQGNRIPKMLSPLSDAHGDPATMQTLRRRIGWIWVLSGFAFAVVWLVVPERLALPIGVAIVLIGIVVPSVIMGRHAKRRGRPLNQ
jgi:hypothetical protein